MGSRTSRLRSGFKIRGDKKWQLPVVSDESIWRQGGRMGESGPSHPSLERARDEIPRCRLSALSQSAFNVTVSAHVPSPLHSHVPLEGTVTKIITESASEA
jgi:hypothetical protein